MRTDAPLTLTHRANPRRARVVSGRQPSGAAAPPGRLPAPVLIGTDLPRSARLAGALPRVVVPGGRAEPAGRAATTRRPLR
jgi:hypothetical protein